MAVFDFPYHTVETEYPDSGTQVQMGKSYTFTAPPSAPDQRKFTLNFEALVYFVRNGVIDATYEPQINMQALDDFYNLHKMNAVFTYPHPVYGDLPCSFAKPLKIPKGTKGGNGVVENIEIQLIEKPGMSDSGVSDLTLVQYEDFP